VPDNAPSLPDFTRWPSFPFEGNLRVKELAPPVAVEPPRSGEDAAECVACNTPDDSYIWFSERWRVRAMDRPTGLPIVLILECRSHLDLGDLPNLLAAELGVMTVRLERAIRTLDDVARVHVNRWGDGSAHRHMWFLARPYGRLQLRGTFLSLWDDILPTIPEQQWRENLALVAAWLAEFGGQANAEPPHIQWQSPSTFSVSPTAGTSDTSAGGASQPSKATEAKPDAGASAGRSGADGTVAEGASDYRGASPEISKADKDSTSNSPDTNSPVDASPDRDDPPTANNGTAATDTVSSEAAPEADTKAVPRQTTADTAEPRMTAH
jgi:hypothetical protein